ncbi:MAG: hypothetical protein M1814_000914 [Vezdaea aestivalis]|nr:MAG: hypothetical protein M1814_000914 [Vezdaea aestivalis]
MSLSRHSRPALRISKDGDAPPVPPKTKTPWKGPPVSAPTPSWIPSGPSKSVVKSAPPWQAYEPVLDVIQGHGLTLATSRKAGGQIKAIRTLRKKPALFEQAELLTALKHVGIIGVDEIYRASEKIYVVTDYVRFTLAEVTAVVRRFKETQIRYIVHAVLAALEYLRSKSLNYGHVDLQAVRVTYGGVVKLGRSLPSSQPHCLTRFLASVEDSVLEKTLPAVDMPQVTRLLLHLMNREFVSDICIEDCKSRGDLHIRDISEWSNVLLDFVDTLVQNTATPQGSDISQCDFLSGVRENLESVIAFVCIQNHNTYTLR